MAKKTSKKKPDNPQGTPRTRRKVLYAGLAIVAMAAGYGLGEVFPDKTVQRAPDSAEVKAWYTGQGATPGLVDAPDSEFIFPEDVIDEPQPAPKLANRAVPQRKPQSPDTQQPPQDPAIATPPPPTVTIIPRSPAVDDVAVAPPVQDQPTERASNSLLIPSYEPAWLAHALDIPDPGQRPVIAIVIDDMGLDRKRSTRIVEMPSPLTLAYLPYARNLDRQATTAREEGHELLLHLPMQAISDAVDPGPNHLNLSLDEATMQDRLEWNLAQFEGYVGVNNHMGSRLTSNRDAMVRVMQELKRRELLFLDSRTTGSSVAAKVAGEFGVPHAVRNVFLDNTNDKDAVLKQLSALERVARRHGRAVGIGHPRDGTIAALEQWLPDAWEKGFVLVPLSMIVKKNQGLAG